MRVYNIILINSHYYMRMHIIHFHAFHMYLYMKMTFFAIDTRMRTKTYILCKGLFDIVYNKHALAFGWTTRPSLNISDIYTFKK